MVSLAQLTRIGYSDRAVHYLAKEGVLHRIHRGVYAATVTSDRAGQLDRDGLERELNQAQVMRLLDFAQLRETLTRAGPRRGTGRLVPSSTTPSAARPAANWSGSSPSS